MDYCDDLEPSNQNTALGFLKLSGFLIGTLRMWLQIGSCCHVGQIMSRWHSIPVLPAMLLSHEENPKKGERIKGANKVHS